MIFKLIVGIVLSLSIAQVIATNAPAEDVAVLIIPAPQVDVSQYQGLQQRLAAKFGPRGMVSVLNMQLSSFNYNYNPEREIKAALDQTAITSPRKTVVLVGHSWGGHAVQNFMNKYKEGTFEDWRIWGGVLLGSSIQRQLITVQKDGSSYVDFGLGVAPIMMFGAELDGLNRITRFAESFYHTNTNINSKQQTRFYNILMKGMNHAQFANETMEQPSFIKKNDLKAESSAEQNLDTIVQLIGIKFFEEMPMLLNKMLADTKQYMEPFVEAMEMEGYYQLKKPCYASPTINPQDPSCFAGSPFASVANKMMADDGQFKNLNVTMKAFDEFHRASTIWPVHHPVIDGSCTLDSTTACEFTTYSITENYYVRHNDFTLLDKFQVAAWDMRVKMKSRQALRIASGEKDADFHKYDEVGNRCAEINQWALDWAQKSAHNTTMDRYGQHGQKLVIADDRNTINGGLWIYAWMTYTESEDKSQVAASSYAYRMGEYFPIKAFAGDHYCKLLSPFKALEWIYVDSLYHNYQAFKEETPVENSFLQ